jgi:hypothetical protein
MNFVKPSGALILNSAFLISGDAHRLRDSLLPSCVSRKSERRERVWWWEPVSYTDQVGACDIRSVEVAMMTVVQ